MKFFATIVLGVLLIAAAPTTKPKSAVPKEWPLVENKTYHFQFHVPDKWEKNQQSDTVAAYLLPRKTAMRRDLFVAVTGKCHAATVDELAKSTRDALTAATDGTKILKDEATTLGDRPAWLFVFNAPYKVTTRIGNDPPKDIVKNGRVYKVLTVGGTTLYDVSLQADASSYDSDLPILKKVLDSFEWTAPAGASS